MTITRNRPGKPLLHRLMRKTVLEANGCLTWQGGDDSRGYGRISDGTGDSKRMVSTHRAAYERLVGPIPEGHEIDHLCEMTRCWRPDHLEPVLRGEHARRGAERAAAVNERLLTENKRLLSDKQRMLRQLEAINERLLENERLLDENKRVLDNN